MSTQEQWIHLSVFYNRREWRQLLTKCILPFIISMKERSYLNTFCIYLNNERGSNIRLSMLPNELYKDVFLQETDIHLKNFLFKYPCSPGESSLFKWFFMDFPENHIYYNLYKPLLIPFDEPVKKVIQVQQDIFSTILIEALGDEPLDDNSIFTFLTYCIWSAVISNCSIDEKLILYINEMIDYLSEKAEVKEEPHKLNLNSEERIQQFMPVILAIKNDVEADRCEDPTLDWLANWKRNCRETFNKFSLFVPAKGKSPEAHHSVILQLHFFYYDNLCRQLGMNTKSTVHVFNIIKKAYACQMSKQK